MSVNRPRKRGSYAPLSVNFYKDKALIAAGVRAELLFVRGLAFCAETLSDGFIADEQLPLLTRGMRQGASIAALLVQQGVWTRTQGGFNVTRWLDYNRSKDAITGAEAKDRARKNPSSAPDGTSPSERNSDTVPNGTTGARAAARGVSNSSSTPKETSVASLPRRSESARNKEIGSGGDGGGQPARVGPGSISAADVVAAWVEATQANDVSPTARTKGMVAKEAKSLLEAGNNADRLLQAAVNAGTKGFPNLERELTAMSGKSIPRYVTSAPTRDDKVRALMERAAQERAKEAAKKAGDDA